MTEQRRYALVRLVLAVTGFVGAAVVLWTLAMSLVNSPLAELNAEQRLGRVTFLTQVGLGACLLALGGFLAVRVGGRAGVLTLAGYVTAQGLATGYLFSLLILGVGGSVYFLSRLLVNLMAYSLAIRTTQLFPRALVAEDRFGIDPSSVLHRLSGPVFLLLGARRVWTFSLCVLLLLAITRSEVVFNVGQFMVIAVAVLTMATSYRVGDAADRRRIYWLLLGAEILFVGRLAIMLGEFALDWYGVAPAASMRYLRAPAWTIANIGLIACLLTAVFYEGAIDPRLVVRRTAVYTLVTGALVFSFAIFENYVAERVALTLGLGEGLVEAVGAGVVALMLKPVHDLLAGLSRRFIPDAIPEAPGTPSGA